MLSGGKYISDFNGVFVSSALERIAACEEQHRGTSLLVPAESSCPLRSSTEPI